MLFRWHVISDLEGKEIVGSFYEKELQKTNQEEFRADKVINRKGAKLHVKWSGYYSSLTVGLMRKILYKWVNIFQNKNPQEEEWKSN